MRPLHMFALVSALALLPNLAQAAEATAAFDDKQKAAVEAIVRELLTKKEPEIVMIAAQELQEKMEKESANKGQAGLEKNADKVFKDPTSPVGGNPKGDVTLVEFFDYTCGYCKMAQEAVTKALAADKNVRMVYKEFPILGPNAEVASKAALAAVEQGKYVPFHEALMSAKDRLSMESIKKIAKSVGLDVEKLTKDMESDKIAAIIKANRDLANELQIRGTPGFVIGQKVYPGALTAEQLKQAIAEARKADKK